jgi:hypothetical protein
VDQRANEVGTRDRVGRVVGGHRRTEDRGWVAVATPRSSRARDGYWSRFGRRFGWVLLVVGCLLVFLFAAMAFPVRGVLWLPILAIEAFLLVALPVGLIVAAFPARPRDDGK